jgi:hypothetical protein
MVGIFINFTGLLKHYSPHYALVLCASLSCLLLVLINEKFPRPLVGVAGALLLGALTLNLYGYSVSHFANLQKVSAVQRDLQKIQALPIAPGEKRVWGYFSPVKAGVLPMIVQYAGSPFVAKAVYGDATAVDVVPTSDRSVSDWKYVFFPKNHFPTREALAAKYRKQFDFAVTEFEIEPTDRIDELETWFVLTRKPEAADAPQ